MFPKSDAMLLDPPQDSPARAAGSPHTQMRRYRFTSLLGTGGFGEVYLAEAISSTGFRKQVAIKILKDEWADHAEVRGRLRDEAAMLGLLRHPNIVSAENFSVLDGQPALVMEYVPGINLMDAIKMGRDGHAPGVRAVAEIGAAIAAALDAAYWQPASSTNEPIAVLHRDVKPSNVRLTPHGEVKLLDFGIARSDVLDRSVETTQSQPGSLSYMAPELLQGRRATPASDVYSLGVVLMESFTCKRFGWAGPNEEEHRTKVTTALQRLSHIPTPFVGLLAEVLAYDPQRRPLASDLVRACRGLARNIGGPDLREWCEARAVPKPTSASGAAKTGQLVGRVFLEDTGTGGKLVETNLHTPHAPLDTGEASEPTATPVMPPTHTRMQSGTWSVVGIGVVLLVGGLAWFSTQRAPSDPIDFVLHSPKSRSLESSAAPAEEAAARASIQAPPAEPTAPPSAAPPPSKATPAKPAPATPPAAPRRIKLSSVPLGLEIAIDGRPTGKKTPTALTLTPGRHTIRFGDGPSVNLTVPRKGRELFTYDQLAKRWRE